jgi:hypothetical protein
VTIKVAIDATESDHQRLRVMVWTMSIGLAIEEGNENLLLY